MMAGKGLFQSFDDVFVLDGVRTPMVDYLGAFADANPIDLGIKAARAVLERAGVDPAQVDSVLAGNMAPGSGFAMEALIAAIAQADPEAKGRLKDFLEKRAPKVTRS